jgi:hypothetical protein
LAGALLVTHLPDKGLALFAGGSLRFCALLDWILIFQNKAVKLRHGFLLTLLGNLQPIPSKWVGQRKAKTVAVPIFLCMVNVGKFLTCKVLFMRYLFCIALILVCTSCATTLRSYPGDKRPTSEIAVLTVPKLFNSSAILITNVDGKITRMKLIDSLELLPGEHLISVECVFPFKLFKKTRYSDNLKINVMAGHSYRVEFQNKQFCLKDLTVNTTVTCGDSAKGVQLKSSGGIFIFPIF